MTHLDPDKPGRAQAFAAFNALRLCHRRLGLSSQALRTLQALLSFLPEVGSQIIHAANRTICERAAISESTLRRHLNELYHLNLLERRDSPNRKRYRLSDPEGADMAFGLDIGPLLSLRDELLAQAAEQKAMEARMRIHRQRILSALARLENCGQGLPADEAQAMRNQLRRRQTVAQLEAVAEELEARLPCPATREMTASNSQNDRHIEASHKDNLLLKEGPVVDGEIPDNAESVSNETCNEDLSLDEIARACPDAMCFAIAPVRTREELRAFGWSLGSMAGIPTPLLHAAAQRRGMDAVVMTILGIVQRGGAIRNPGGYFRSLMLGRLADVFNPGEMMRRLVPT